MFSQAKVTIIGTLADKPVIRLMDGHRKMVGLNVYTARRLHDAKTDQGQQKKEWHRVVITNQRLATYAEEHLTKDDDICLEGELHTDFWRDATHELQSITYIILCQEGDRLRRVTDELDGKDREIAAGMLTIARDARHATAPTADSLLECVA